MGKIDKINMNMEVVAPILGCSKREDCQATSLPLRQLTSDLERLNNEIEPEYGVTLELALADRITYMGMCDPSTCEQTGACALRGAFVPTSTEMAVAQDANLRLSKD